MLELLTELVLVVLTDIGTTDRTGAGSTNGHKKDPVLDLALCIPIRTAQNLWEIWKILLEKASNFDKTTPLYILEDHGRLSTSNKPIDLFTTTTPLCPLPTPCCCSSLDPTTKDGALGSPVGLGQPGSVHAPTGSITGESFDCFFASLPEN